MVEILTLEQLYQYGFEMVWYGFVLGCFPMIVGLAVEITSNIFRK